MNDWKIFRGNSEPHDRISELPEPPSWRKFISKDEELEILEETEKRWQAFCDRLAKEPVETRDQQRGKNFRIHTDEKQARNDVTNLVNAALYLRRPLLVTGKPGTGKTSLGYAVAYELKLGSVLLWPITARSTLQDGLYRYDAIARLQDVQIKQTDKDIGRYIQLGALGTALLPSRRPRVLIIDEIDKSDINLPNDLLNLFEEGKFEIPELARIAKEKSEVEVRTYDGFDVPIREGNVSCHNFPLIILTNNGERDFPPPFLRRCLRLTMPFFINFEKVPLTEIPAGTVGVVISHVGKNLENDNDKEQLESSGLVKLGYKGICEMPLLPGIYPINTRVKDVVIVPTHEIFLDWSNKNKPLTNYDYNLYTLRLRSKDGFTIELEVTQIIKIDPKDAPKIISHVGSSFANRIERKEEVFSQPYGKDSIKYRSIRNLITRVIEPVVNSCFRNSALAYDALDFLNKRNEIQVVAKDYIEHELNAYGIQSVGTFINESDLLEELEQRLTKRILHKLYKKLR